MNPWLIIHPITGDRAEAEDRQGAETAARTLRKEATRQGCNPRAECLRIRQAQEGES